jgi:hypothetical protein
MIRAPSASFHDFLSTLTHREHENGVLYIEHPRGRERAPHCTAGCAVRFGRIGFGSVRLDFPQRRVAGVEHASHSICMDLYC